MMKILLILLLACNPLSIFADNAKSYKSQNESLKQFLHAKSPQDFGPIPYSKILYQDGIGTVYEWEYPSETVASPTTGYTQRPLAEIRHIKKTLEHIIFDAVYHFDIYGRRINLIGYDRDKHKRFIALFGCSFTYGNGINDNETLNYHLNHQAANRYAYNYAIAGSGPHMMLAQMEATDFSLEMMPPSGDFIYIYNDFHVPRANFFMNEQGWLSNTPVYEKVDGKMKKLGSFAEVHPYKKKLYGYIGKFYNWAGIHKNFPGLTDEHYDYVCNLISATRDLQKEKYPHSRFHVYAHPTEKMSPYLESCLKKRNISLIKSRIQMDHERYVIKGDGHPNSILNELIAKEILGSL